MTTDAAPSVDDLGRNLARTSMALFLAGVGLALILLATAGRLSDALGLDHSSEGVLAPTDVLAAVALAPLHLNLLSPLPAKWLLGAWARGRVPADSIFVVRGDRETWRLFAHGTAATAAALAALWAGGYVWSRGSQIWSPLTLLLALVLTVVLANVFGFYRLIVITVLFFRHGASLREAVGVLSRTRSAYRDSLRFFIEAVEGRREVVLERVDGADVKVKYVDAAQLAAAHGGAAEQPGTIVEGVYEVWRAAGPDGAKALAHWFEGR